MSDVCKQWPLLSRALIVVVMLIFCVACGQKGPLFLPDEAQQQQKD